MTIAIEISHIDDFYYNCFNNIASQHPDFTFIFIYNKNIESGKITCKNIEHHSLKNGWLKFLFGNLFINQRVYGILKKRKANIYFCIHPSSYLNKRIKTVTYINRGFLLKNKNELLQKSFCLIVENCLMKDELMKQFHLSDKKINVIPFGSKIYSPFEQSKKEEVKKKIISGKEFFVVDGKESTEQELIEVLKSFSYFKKWQQSEFKLIVMLSENQQPAISNLIKNYKYREDVILFSKEQDSISETCLLSSAYAAIFVAFNEKNTEKIMSCFGLKTPVVIAESDYIQSSFSDNVLYFSGKELSEKMILLYKNESLRSNLIERAAAYSETVSWEKIAEKIWNEIIENSQE
jgi:glycosyltransferase involved in cell wall biosynthesis